ncbi:class I SAM-dependent methyltransferase [Sedimentibacter hydroxybenzoicus DSM 7310]|uniref:Class I SAM-dependent methyltransferase n=1 Tax=Sedimentibacter hydroxybenzoicus DSM 7310 TaxID=1123245 RepID=A0A974BKP8_SEDHY|nr:class I SAM-dependent methyltransferase [Sedimentibacter hydroxybenzoicus]NYB74944.1 class I SAM-dependent methyltransferase [Sedimentibacter hydroxybenzoicus DSM 7310]
MATLKQENTTIEYYNQNADMFINTTIDADMSELYSEFEKYLSIGCSILDIGCGSGRDSKYFSQKGYSVTSLDASKVMCERTQLITNNVVIQMKAEDIFFEAEFDAVWACASLLHVSKENMLQTMLKIVVALKDSGVLYGSWKYGTGVHDSKGRYFADYTEKTLTELLAGIKNVTVLKLWVTADVRREKNEEKWINVIIKKGGK